MKLKKGLLTIIIGIMLCSVLTGCSEVGKAEKAFEAYKDMWIQKDFKGMYGMLSNEAKEYISEEEFLARYNNIYSAIAANNLTMETNGEIAKGTEGIEVPFKLDMDTVAGKLSLKDFKMNLIKEDKEYKVKWNESLILPQMVAGDKVKIKTTKAKRGSILDREGHPLAKDGIVKSVGLYPLKFENGDVAADIKAIADILDISEEGIAEKLKKNTDPNHFVPIVDVLAEDPRLSKVEELKNDGILINDKESRVYAGGEAVGRLIGYIGSITEEELTKNSDKGYSNVSLIGKTGIEQVYEDKLKASDAAEIYIERGEEKIPVINREAKNGENVKLAIDLSLQSKIYSEMNGEKGAAAAVDPKTGEIIALVSSPSYDSNVFTTYATKTQKKNWEETDYANQENRFNKVYSPGSTMKLITASVGVDDGIIKPDEAKDIKGLNWQNNSTWGGYQITRVEDPGKPVNLKDAVNYSDNIYFAQAALEIGDDKFVEGIKKFGIGEELDAGYPMENSKISNDGKLKDEILLADTAYGQGQIMVTPLNMALAYSALGNDGNIMKPRLVISDENKEAIWEEGAISKNNLPVLIDTFTALINNPDGSTTDAKIDGFKIAGKTGTAEIKKSKDDENGTENGWFVGVNVDDSKISLAMIMEDVKNRGGSHFTVPKVKNAMEFYLK